jgi:hypothetical protein
MRKGKFKWKRILGPKALAIGLFSFAALMALPTLAHHSYAAYDPIQTITLKGTVETFH